MNTVFYYSTDYFVEHYAVLSHALKSKLIGMEVNTPLLD
jgi:hypothetical protein